MSPVVDATSPDSREDAITTTADAVRAGEVVVIPTDTVYGIGCDAFSAEAVQAVLDAKGRGRDMPPPVLVPDQRTLDGLARDVPAWVRDLVEAEWPGPLTVVVHAQPSLHWDLGETRGTVALRMPDDELALAVLAEVGPMAVTSANRTGEPPARTAVEAASQLGASVAVYLDGGPRPSGEPSTIVDCTGDEPVILRSGALPASRVRQVFADAQPAEPPPPSASVDDTSTTHLDTSDTDSDTAESEGPTR
ncbi:L-threonylcarbamoyladenylate synthase [Janibacter melonis]|uniref:L-threonylcarbamoyladenylate synthase n=1 Tax=Janibacter melonis TaxID=262209 RepID=UPI0017827AA0|nr:threonylcarbamoyl-AMP synthase [Janibacter melonis]